MAEGLSRSDQAHRDVPARVAEALQAAFDRGGHAVTALPHPSPGWRAVGAVVRDGERDADVLQGEDGTYSAQFRHRDVRLAGGTTTDLDDVAGAFAAWLGGAPTAVVGTSWPFVRYDPWAVAVERGEATEFRWRQYLGGSRPAHVVDLLPFLRVAAEEPRLRALYPFTSHRSLLLRRDVFDRSGVNPVVEPVGEGRYRVYGPDRRELGLADAVGAVELLVPVLPPAGDGADATGAGEGE